MWGGGGDCTVGRGWRKSGNKELFYYFHSKVYIYKYHNIHAYEVSGYLTNFISMLNMPLSSIRIKNSLSVWHHLNYNYAVVSIFSEYNF